jgi:ribonuclease P protein component
MRISKKNEERVRKKDCKPPTPPRPQRADARISYAFPKSAKLRSKAHYQRVARLGSRFSGESIAIFYCLGTQAKLGITVSRRFGRAHRRNRFKRVVREAFRLQLPHFSKPLHLNVAPKAAALPSVAAVEKDLHSLLKIC